jgi:adenylate cyclase
MPTKINSDLKRRLAAIVAVDVVGSSRLMEADEAGALSAIRTVLNKVLKPAAARHGGRIIKLLGDGALLEFPSPVLAVRCAVDVQETVEERAGGQPDDKKIRLRIGINIGDVRVTEDGDVYGDSVNVAARLEGIAEPGSIYVAGKVFDELEGKLALPFADEGERQLKGIARHVRAYSLRAGGSSAREPMASGPVADNAGRPSIAVLPFANLSGDPEQDYFADGIADDIYAALAKSRWLFVMGRSSAFAFRGKAFALDEIARKLGVRYVLSGTVRRSLSKVRVAAQVVEAESGELIWAEHYDRDVSDVLQLQDEITEAVAAAIEPQLMRKEGERGIQRPKSLTAWDLVRRVMWHFHKFTPADHEKAIGFFQEATRVEPTEASGYIWLARAEGSRLSILGTPDREESLRVASLAARKGVELDPENPYAHHAVAAVCVGNGEFEQSVRAAQHAVSLNPGFALGYCQCGSSNLLCGRPQDAIDYLERGLRLSPYDPQNFFWSLMLGWSFYLTDQQSKALITTRQSLYLRPDWSSALKTLAAIALASGQQRLAEESWRQSLTTPNQTPDLIGLLRRPHPEWIKAIEKKARVWS